MKSLRGKLRKLRSNASGHKASIEQPNDNRSVSSSSFPQLLQNLAITKNRLGLYLIPSLPLEPSTTTQNFNVDIIAVHGLGGDFFKTWNKTSSTSGENDVFWLSQLLPIDLPGARVYSFGYESRPAFSRSVATIKEFAQQLLQSLLDRVEADKLRPLIFICHSLGGIVVKQAMVLAHENERFTEVLRMTKSIMFMGTPHSGSDIATLLGPLIQTVNFWLKISGGSAFTGVMRDDLVGALSRNSDALDDINDSFILRTRNMHIISCYELERPENLSQLIVTRQSAKLSILDEEKIALQANHMSMCRFSSSQDPRYRSVVEALLRVVRTLSEPKGSLSLTSTRSLYSLTDSERKYTTYFKRDFQPAILSERVEGTCRWLLDTSQYQKWQDDNSSAILWITGDAGCGKTTLISFMTEMLKTEEIKEGVVGSLPVVMAFFCAKDVSTRNDGQSIVCGLLISILTSRRNLIRLVKKKFTPVRQESGQSLEFLWNILTFAIDVASCDRYYIVIDALDECQPQSREKLLMCIGRMLDVFKGKDWHRHKKLKLLFTSQPQTITEWRALKNTSSLYHVKIEDQPSGVTQDILKVINHKVDQLVRLHRYEALFADELKKELYRRAQNSFLWVSLVLAFIKTTILIQPNDPRELLAQLPPDNLKDAYTKYLPPSTPQNTGVIRRCVQLLVASLRTLTLEEIRAFASMTSHGRDPATQQQLIIVQNSLELMFGPLVRFPDLRVELVHSTVKEYFLELGKDTTHTVAKIYGTNITSAHLAFAEACVNYLLGDDMSTDLFIEVEPSSAATMASISPIDPLPDNSDSSMDIFDIEGVKFFRDEEDMSDEACSRIKRLFPPFDYAATNWAHHYASCEQIAPEALTRKVRLLSNPTNINASNWYKYMAHQSRTIVPSFHKLDELLVAAMFDHPQALRSMLSYRNDESLILEKRCQSGLFWAASRGNSRAVQAFLDHGTNPNFLENGQSPLIVAILAGHQSVCSILLDTHLTDPNLGDTSSRSPLVHAVASDQHKVISMLLGRKDILVDLSDHSGFTPLLKAALSGCLQCLRCLEGRSDFTRRDKKRRNVLSYVACTESLDSVELILKKLTSEEVHKSDTSGRNAISYAAEQSLLPIVRRLWNSQISVAQRDSSGRNAVSWAVSRRPSITQKDEDNTVLQFLVRKCPQEAKVQDISGWSPLAWALNRPGDLNAVKVLVEVGGVDINQQDHSGRSVLSWAANEGFEHITHYLLQASGIEKNLQDFTGRTPISYAASSGSINVLRLLLNDQEVDPSMPDDQGRSPLDWAQLNHRDEVVQELSSLNLTRLDGV